MSRKIAMLGMGAMGSRMAARLLEADHDLVVYNRNPNRCTALVERGAKSATTPAEAAAGADVVIAMVRDDAASRRVWLDPEQGAMAAMKRGAIAIESSTLTVGWAQEISQAASSQGVGWLDAPVAGSRPQAEAGQLAFIVGGEASTLRAVEELLSQMGGAVHHVGGPTRGAAMKLAINALFGIQVAALAEVLGFLQRAGIEPSSAVQTLGALPTTSPAMRGMGALIAGRKFDPMFPIELVEKDFGYVLDAAASVGTETPTVAAVRAVYGRAVQQGLGDENISAVAKLY